MSDTPVRSLDVAIGASMDMVTLNNLVRSMHYTVRAAKVRVINKIVRKLRVMDKDEKVYYKRLDLEKEMQIIKSLNCDIVSKFALGNKSRFSDVYGDPRTSIDMKALMRLTDNKLIQDKVKAFRESHADWQALVNYLQAHQSGRRFKKKTNKTGMSYLADKQTGAAMIANYIAEKFSQRDITDAMGIGLYTPSTMERRKDAKTVSASRDDRIKGKDAGSPIDEIEESEDKGAIVGKRNQNDVDDENIVNNNANAQKTVKEKTEKSKTDKQKTKKLKIEKQKTEKVKIEKERTRKQKTETKKTEKRDNESDSDEVKSNCDQSDAANAKLSQEGHNINKNIDVQKTGKQKTEKIEKTRKQHMGKQKTKKSEKIRKQKTEEQQMGKRDADSDEIKSISDEQESNILARKRDSDAGENASDERNNERIDSEESDGTSDSDGKIMEKSRGTIDEISICDKNRGEESDSDERDSDMSGEDNDNEVHSDGETKIDAYCDGSDSEEEDYDDRSSIRGDIVGSGHREAFSDDEVSDSNADIDRSDGEKSDSDGRENENTDNVERGNIKTDSDGSENDDSVGRSDIKLDTVANENVISDKENKSSGQESCEEFKLKRGKKDPFIPDIRDKKSGLVVKQLDLSEFTNEEEVTVCVEDSPANKTDQNTGEVEDIGQQSQHDEFFSSSAGDVVESGRYRDMPEYLWFQDSGDEDVFAGQGHQIWAMNKTQEVEGPSMLKPIYKQEPPKAEKKKKVKTKLLTNVEGKPSEDETLPTAKNTNNDKSLTKSTDVMEGGSEETKPKQQRKGQKQRNADKKAKWKERRERRMNNDEAIQADIRPIKLLPIELPSLPPKGENHPSWIASRQRKAQSQIAQFQGKKMKFDDSD